VIRIETPGDKPKSKTDVERLKNGIKGVISDVVKVAINTNLVKKLETSQRFENLKEQDIPEIKVFSGELIVWYKYTRCKVYNEKQVLSDSFPKKLHCIK